MSKYSRKRGSTSNMVRVFILDNTATDGRGLTGLVFNSTNLQIAIIREFESSPTIYTGAGIENITTIGTFQAPSTSSKCRFKVVDGTNMPGVYEIHFHDDAGHFGSGDASKNLQIYIFEITTTALNIKPLPAEIQLTAIDFEDAVRMGLTALPNAVAEALGGLYTRGSGAGQINQPASGIIDSNVERWKNTAVNEQTAGYPAVTVKDGSGTGEINTNGGKVVGVELVDTTTINTDMVTEPPTAVQNRQEMDSNSTQLGLIVADTNEMQGKLPTNNIMGSSDKANHDSNLTDIQSRLPAALVGGKMDSNTGAISGSTSAADKLEASAETIILVTVVADAGNSTTQFKTDLTETTDGHFNGRTVIFTSGNLSGSSEPQATRITDYDGTNKILTVVAMTETPAPGNTLNIV